MSRDWLVSNQMPEYTNNSPNLHTPTHVARVASYPIITLQAAFMYYTQTHETVQGFNL